MEEFITIAGSQHAQGLSPGSYDPARYTFLLSKNEALCMTRKTMSDLLVYLKVWRELIESLGRLLGELSLGENRTLLRRFSVELPGDEERCESRGARIFLVFLENVVKLDRRIKELLGGGHIEVKT